jgi:hypothetical protein
VRIRTIGVLVGSLAAVACGKKGPPLPPLVRLPSAPADFAAELRGTTVDLQFTVPAANTDNSRPANVQRVDVYAITSSDTLSDAQIVKHGKRVARVDVKAPKDPDAPIEEDEPLADMEQPEGTGLDQGAHAHVSETLDRGAVVPAAVPADRKHQPEASAAALAGPLLPPRVTPLTRTYLAVGVTTRDKNGPSSRRVAVPLVPPPPPPGRATITYNEKAVTVKWPAVNQAPPIQRAPQGDELPSKLLGFKPVTIQYHLYDATQPDAPVRLTSTPLAEPTFLDSRVTWGERRCYIVRTVESLTDLTIESEAPAPVCETLKDTFPPAAPARLQSSPQESAISLIWDANTEKDLDGYIVFRGPSAEALAPIVSAPIQLTQFRDENLQPGVRYVYVVKAVDKAGNQSAASNAVEEAAR